MGSWPRLNSSTPTGDQVLPETRPIDECYWVEPGRLLAGEYPGHWNPEAARERLARFLDHGVTRFVDLTHPRDGLDPYREILLEEARRSGRSAEYAAFPIDDMGVPARPEDMQAALECIRQGIEAGAVTYVHCWGGIGRTGTVIGCWLIERGFSPDEALARLRAAFFTMPKAPFFGGSPQTPAQFDWVRGWRASLGHPRPGGIRPAATDSGRGEE